MGGKFSGRNVPWEESSLGGKFLGGKFLGGKFLGGKFWEESSGREVLGRKGPTTAAQSTGRATVRLRRRRFSKDNMEFLS